jgi:hypothetical protein
LEKDDENDNDGRLQSSHYGNNLRL